MNDPGKTAIDFDAFPDINAGAVRLIAWTDGKRIVQSPLAPLEALILARNLISAAMEALHRAASSQKET